MSDAYSVTAFCKIICFFPGWIMHLLLSCVVFGSYKELKSRIKNVISYDRVICPVKPWRLRSAQTAIKSFVAGKFPNLQFWFIGCHIPKQSFLLSGSLYKFKTALRTGNGNLSLSFWHTDDLVALRTAAEFLCTSPFNELHLYIIFYRIP